MYETILVLLDGSKRAEKIMPHVEGLANCLGSKLILLRVVEPVYYVMEPEVSYASINLDETNWQRALETLRDRLSGLAAWGSQAGQEKKQTSCARVSRFSALAGRV